MRLLHTDAIAGFPRNRASLQRIEQERLRTALASGLSRDDGGGPTEASGQPPSYYALGAVLYSVSPWRGLFQRFALLRMLSALCAGATVLMSYLFLRECLGGASWTWTIGALSIAFQPAFAHLGGGVTPDNLLFAASAGVFWALARAFRRGLSPGAGALVGGTVATGLLTKLTFLGLVPPIVVAIAFLALRRKGGDPQGARTGAALAIAIPLAAVGGYVALSVGAWDRPAFAVVLGGNGEASTDTGSAGALSSSIAHRLSYTWQLYAPRLPFMRDLFEYSPPYDTWFKGFIGRFGWLDYEFPPAVYVIALSILVCVAVAGGVFLVRQRSEVARRWAEIVVYTGIAGGLMVEIGIAGLDYRNRTGYIFEQARYMLPLLPLYGALIVMAVRSGFGSARGEAVGKYAGAVVVMLAMAHNLFAQLLTLGRYYA